MGLLFLFFEWIFKSFEAGYGYRGNNVLISYRICSIDFIINRNLKQIASREVSCYSISAKNQVNIDITLQWLIKKGKGK